MEIKLALVLGLPQRFGGFGLPAPELNAVVPLGEESRALYKVASCRCDLFWPQARLDVEYDGLEFHKGDSSRTEDAARGAALEAEGISVMRLTFPQVADKNALLAVGKVLSGKLGLQWRFRSDAFPERYAALRELLELDSPLVSEALF